MDKISELKRILGENLAWNKARLDCFVCMLTALFVVRTVNLSEIAVAFSSKAEKNSRYKRLQRFFAQFKIDYTLIARLVFRLFFSKPCFIPWTRNCSIYICRIIKDLIDL
ncbi:hypothetical protein [Legionella fairfieldensis]|uniref:hypothetical protein n=1 Tax=Legionella fairfieldensis TaxID=45064 RepID=UPI0010413D95|nr:hypothetical protein [Legionella fairfieldensis]